MHIDIQYITQKCYLKIKETLIVTKRIKSIFLARKLKPNLEAYCMRSLPNLRLNIMNK